ncbi:MAG: DinB family protein [Bryobacterales bacterium]|nr:DinB family protein [Acidobacteriota bacterium]MCB9383469.1 DinB family protein [Bryobacterales bacterium]
MIYARTSDLTEALAELRAILDSAPSTLGSLSEAEAAAVRPSGGWSRKQILGHLIDSAGVNLQRFLRGQIEQGFSLAYPQEEFVELNGYQQRTFANVFALWLAMNRQLLHVAERIPAEKLSNLCGRGGGEDWTLRFRVIDYVGHMQHHLDQIRDFSGAGR